MFRVANVVKGRNYWGQCSLRLNEVTCRSWSVLHSIISIWECLLNIIFKICTSLRLSMSNSCVITLSSLRQFMCQRCNLCNPFNLDLRCASLCGVELVFKKRRERRAQRRSGLKGLQRFKRLVWMDLRATSMFMTDVGDKIYWW